MLAADQTWSLLDYVMNDDRFAANVTAVGVGLFAVLVSWILLKSLLATTWAAILRVSQQPVIRETGARVHVTLQTWLWWGFVAASCAMLAVGGGYHAVGGDVGSDVQRAYSQITMVHLLRWGQLAALLAIQAFVAWSLLRAIPKLRPLAEEWTLKRLRKSVPAVESPEKDSSPVPKGLVLLERYALAATILLSLLSAGWILNIGSVVNPLLVFVLRVATILVIARLLTIACQTFARPLENYGDRRFKQGRLNHYWERLSRLLPLGERCFEMAVYTSAAVLSVHELKSFEFFAFVVNYGERAVRCIGIFFGTRVVIESLQVLLNEVFGIYREDGRTSQQARTLVPLLHSVCQYSAYVSGVVWMLTVMGFPAEPILAGAGIIGLAVGLGAQNLVTDVVSGLFILFENQFLVGDYVEIGNSRGIVEAVEVRHTQVRDDHGRLHIIPNGQIKQVVNLSKGFILAVVDIEIPAGSDLELYLRMMAEAGRVLRKSRSEVLADTQIQGLVDLSLTNTTIRAITKVKPGTHQHMENEYRRILKGLLDQLANKPSERVAA